MNFFKKNKLKKLVSDSSEIAGSVTGSAIGLIFAGPVGALVGGASGPIIANVLKKIGSDASERILSSREKIRIGATIAIAADKIQHRLLEGKKLRTDSFFNTNGAGRSDAEQIVESILIKSQRESEEKKIPYIANLLSNIAFDSEFTVGEANHLLHIIEGFTYRKIIILAMIQRKEELKLNLTEDMAFSAKINNRIKPEIIAILQEVFELYHLGLFEDTYGNVPSDWSIVGIGRTKLTMLGIKYCEVLSLDEMPTEDINSVSNIFNLKQIKPSGIQPKQP